MSEQSWDVEPKSVVLVCARGDSAADALAALAKGLKDRHSSDTLLSAVTVYYTGGHYEAEVAARVEP